MTAPGPLLILGIDPGSVHTGFGLVAQEGQRFEAIEFGRLSCPANQPLADRLARLARELRTLVDRHEPDAVVLETPFHGLNSRSLVVLAQARGALLSVLGGRDLEVAEYSPAAVKKAVAGTGRADKRQVSWMVCQQLSIPAAGLSEDASDALAVALCYAHRHQMDRLLKGRAAQRKA